MRAGYGKSLRQYLANNTNPLILIDFSGTKVFTTATVDVNILMFSKESNAERTMAVIAKDDCLSNLSVYIMQNYSRMHLGDSGSWTILSSVENQIKEKIEASGTLLKQLDISINFGIKTGYNDAFIIDDAKRIELISTDSRSAELIRPILRGRDIRRYDFSFQNLYVIFAYFGSHMVIPERYPAIYQHLKLHENKLKERGQCRYTSSGRSNDSAGYPGQHHWLELDNNPRKENLDEFSKQKIVWARLMRISKTEHLNFPRFALIEENFVVQDSLCFITGKHLPLLCALLNSDMAIYYYFTQIASLDEGGLQMRQQYIEQFPIPDLNNEIANRITELLGSPLGPNDLAVRSQINQLVFELYNLNETEIRYIQSHNRTRFNAIMRRK